MIKHIVMWKLLEQAEGNSKAHNAQLAKAKLEALNGKVPGLLKLEVGIDFSATETSMDLLLYSEFEDRAALQRYQQHPEHVAVFPFMQAIRSERRVVDYETD
ncbi:Dabb family protein [Ketobacter sp.]|uniref:Dabb family protein n=1 Tax=Ketobacter sp. TaxID=2083498 RepID=UPI000F2DB28C|nr:Dabb family protein [Ketobacter sp.]RLU01248.1 MAG: Dabb family protein [Ketobacter sp.]